MSLQDNRLTIRLNIRNIEQFSQGRVNSMINYPVMTRLLTMNVLIFALGIVHAEAQLKSLASYDNTHINALVGVPVKIGVTVSVAPDTFDNSKVKSPDFPSVFSKIKMSLKA